MVNTADPWGARLAGLVRADGRAALTTTQAADADYRAETAAPRADGGWDVRLAHPGGTTDFGLSMLGSSTSPTPSRRSR